MEDDPNFKSISDYRHYIKETFDRIGTVRAGRFYLYFYNFATDYPWDELKFYDWMPLTYVWERDKTHFIGMNFHHMPVRPRLLWMGRVRKLAKQIDEAIAIKGLGGQPIWKIRNLNYPRVYQILRKSKIAIRRYRLDRVKDLRAVDIRYVEDVMHWIARTYMGVSVKTMTSRYLEYKP